MELGHERARGVASPRGGGGCHANVQAVRAIRRSAHPADPGRAGIAGECQATGPRNAHRPGIPSRPRQRARCPIPGVLADRRLWSDSRRRPPSGSSRVPRTLPGSAVRSTFRWIAAGPMDGPSRSVSRSWPTGIRRRQRVTPWSSLRADQASPPPLTAASGSSCSIRSSMSAICCSSTTEAPAPRPRSIVRRCRPASSSTTRRSRRPGSAAHSSARMPTATAAATLPWMSRRFAAHSTTRSSATWGPHMAAWTRRPMRSDIRTVCARSSSTRGSR